MVDSENSYGEKVSRLVGWGHWFAFFNIIAAMLIGTRYIASSPWPDTLLGQFYLFASWIGHFGFLVFALYLLVLFPLTFIVPSRKLFRLITVCFATFGLTVLLIDTQAYQTINLHLSPVVWDLLFSDENSTISSDLQHLFIVLPPIFLAELALAEWVWRKQRKLSHKHVGRPLAALFFVCFIASHLIFIWADAFFYNPVTVQKANFPLSYPMTAKSFMEKHGLLDREEYLQKLKDNEGAADLVRYPLTEIEFNRRSENLNVLIVSINNLRSDMLNPETMPVAYGFALNNQNFINHYSSSNDDFGAFGLLYGLPSSYASSIKSQGTEPLLMSVLATQGYRFELYSGDNFEDDLYSETIFRKFPMVDLTATKSETLDRTISDNAAIEQWSDAIINGSNKPWFGFIELSTVDNFSDYQSQSDAQTAEEHFVSAYSAAATAADAEFGKILQALVDQDLLESTIVILTSNHGTEFNETKTRSWGSNTNYSQYQLRVPMVIHWPGKLAADYGHMTSHLDLAATILEDLSGVSTNAKNFSSGRNLFDERKRKWIIAGDTRELALVTANDTTVVDKFGNYSMYDKDYNKLDNKNPKLPILMQGFTELQRFYAKSQ
jgi:membrane-anchored protein YejM (alkaline phosphatase superfamily)